MRQSVTVFLLCFLSLGVPAAAQEVGEKLAPVYRSDRHFGDGVAFLQRLGPGWSVHIEASDGAEMTFQGSESGLRLELPEAKLVSPQEVVTPLGYRIRVGDDLPEYQVGAEPAIEITAPNGNRTYLYDVGRAVVVVELDGLRWLRRSPETSWRLPDGTRLDELRGYDQWEMTTVDGGRFHLDVASKTWSEAEPLSSALMVADLSIPVLGGDGDDWLLSIEQDHLFFAWDWYPGPLSVEEIVGPIESGPMRRELTLLFNDIERVQPPGHTAAYLLGRRLALTGGDVVTFVDPDGEQTQVYLMPGAHEPDTFAPERYNPRPQLRTR